MSNNHMKRSLKKLLIFGGVSCNQSGIDENGLGRDHPDLSKTLISLSLEVQNQVVIKGKIRDTVV